MKVFLKIKYRISWVADYFVLFFRLLLGLVCLITICSARPADEEYADYEEKPAPVKPTPRHSALLSRRAPIAKPGSLKSTTTTTTPEPVQVNI